MSSVTNEAQRKGHGSEISTLTALTCMESKGFSFMMRLREATRGVDAGVCNLMMANKCVYSDGSGEMRKTT